MERPRERSPRGGRARPAPGHTPTEDPMSWPEQLQDWAQQVRGDPALLGCLVWVARQMYAGSADARDRAADALSEGVTRAVEPYRAGKFDNYAHYRNWV